MTTHFKVWYDAYTFFKTTFIGHRMCYEYDCGNSTRLLEVSMAKKNFAHLCGIHYEYGAVNFARDLETHHIAERNLLFAERKEIIDLKAQIMPCLSMLTSRGVRVTDNGKFLNLSFDHALRSQKEIVALTLTNGNPGTYIPNSLINLNYSKSNSRSIKHSYPVKTLYSISNATGSKYTYF